MVVQPAKIPARIRTIQNHNREVEAIGPGTRTALSLPDVAVAREKNTLGVWRGDVITLSEFGEASAIADVILSRSRRLPMKTRSIKHGTAVRVHHGSANFGARAFFQTSEELGAGETAIAQIRFDEPAFLFAGDRFVIRDAAEQNTLAGGVVLDPDARARNFRSAAQREFLAKRAQAPNDTGVFVATQIARDRAVKRNALVVKSSFSADEIAASLKSANVIERSELLVDAKWWNEFCDKPKRLLTSNIGRIQTTVVSRSQNFARRSHVNRRFRKFSTCSHLNCAAMVLFALAKRSRALHTVRLCRCNFRVPLGKSATPSRRKNRLRLPSSLPTRHRSRHSVSSEIVVNW